MRSVAEDLAVAFKITALFPVLTAFPPTYGVVPRTLLKVAARLVTTDPFSRATAEKNELRQKMLYFKQLLPREGLGMLLLFQEGASNNKELKKTVIAQGLTPNTVSIKIHCLTRKQ